MPVEVRRLGVKKLLVTMVGISNTVKLISTNVFGETIPEAYKRLFGQAMDHHGPNLDHKRTRMATNGLLNRRFRGAAVVLQDQNKKLLRIRILVNADDNKLSSYKTELHDLLGAYILLVCLVPPRLRVLATGIIWCDSESAIRKLAGNDRVTPCSHKEGLSNKFPILAEINFMRKMFPCVSLEWVESHQEVRCLSQHLNLVANVTALLQHQCVSGRTNRRERKLLPLERVQLYYQDTLLESDIKKEIRTHSTGYMAEQYIADKLGLKKMSSE